MDYSHSPHSNGLFTRWYTLFSSNQCISFCSGYRYQRYQKTWQAPSCEVKAGCLVCILQQKVTTHKTRCSRPFRISVDPRALWFQRWATCKVATKSSASANANAVKKSVSPKLIANLRDGAAGKYAPTFTEIDEISVGLVEITSCCTKISSFCLQDPRSILQPLLLWKPPAAWGFRMELL